MPEEIAGWVDPAAPKPKRSRGRPRRSEPTQEVRPENVADAIKMQDEASKATVAELALSFSQLILIGTVLCAKAFNQTVLAMSNKEAAAIARPLASIFSKTSLFRRYGKNLTDSHDYIALLWAVYQYASRVIDGWEHATQPAAYFDTGNLARSSTTGDESSVNGNAGQPSQRVNTNPFSTSPKGQSGTPFFGWRRGD